MGKGDKKELSLTDVMKELKGIFKELKEIRSELKAMQGMRKTVKKITSVILKHDVDLKGLKKQLAELQVKNNEKNLILFGWNPTRNAEQQATRAKKNESLDQKVSAWFREKMGITPRIVGAEYLGKDSALNTSKKRTTSQSATQQKSRPVKIELQALADRKLISSNIRKLKSLPNGERVSISDDIPFEVREARKRRMPELMEQKAKGHKVFFRGIELYVNGSPVAEEDEEDLTLDLESENYFDPEASDNETGNGEEGTDA